MEIRPIRRRRLYQEVAADLQRMISAGALREGDLLPSERDLMERFQVGRPAIREALLSLQQKGLVSISNGERARVTRPDSARLIEALTGAAQLYLSAPDGVRQFQATRRLFESAVAAEAARVASPEAVARVREALADNRASRGDRLRFQRTDVAFHLEIVRALGNPLLVGVHEALSGWLTEQRAVSLGDDGAEARAFAFHERIADALDRRDPAMAEAAMREHLDDVEETYWRRVDAAG